MFCIFEIDLVYWQNGKSSLGYSIYKSITVEFFDMWQFLSTMDMDMS